MQESLLPTKEPVLADAVIRWAGAPPLAVFVVSDRSRLLEATDEQTELYPAIQLRSFLFDKQSVPFVHLPISALPPISDEVAPEQELTLVRSLLRLNSVPLA